MLKPGGVFISSTACLSDSHWYLRPVLPLARMLGLVPLVRFFTRKELVDDLVAAGFEIDRVTNIYLDVVKTIEATAPTE